MKFSVTLASDDVIEVESTNPDRINWDITAAKKKWPTLSEAPFLGMTFIAWSALKRTGLYTQGWDQFSETDCVNVEAVDAETVEANPTQ